MTVNNDTFLEIAVLLSILKNEDELIVKPFHIENQNQNNEIEHGKIVSRTNKHLFNYQIGHKENTSIFNSFRNQKLTLRNPESNEIILELYHNRLPFLSKVSSKQNICCVFKTANENHSISSIKQKFAFAKIWYDIYDYSHEHILSLILHKNYLINRLQHRIPEFEIFDPNEQVNIGRISPFSTLNNTSGQHRQAVTIKIPKDMNVLIKATLLMISLGLVRIDRFLLQF